MSHTASFQIPTSAPIQVASDRVVGGAAVRGPQASVQLTRRGRLAVSLSVLALLVLTLMLVGGRSEATNEPGAAVETRTVTVQSGDTLWAIAADVAPPGETQATVLEIQRLNALPSVSLSRGQQIEVPVG